MPPATPGELQREQMRPVPMPKKKKKKRDGPVDLAAELALEVPVNSRRLFAGRPFLADDEIRVAGQERDRREAGHEIIKADRTPRRW